MKTPTNKLLLIILIVSLLINVYVVIGIGFANEHLRNCDESQPASIPCKDRVVLDIITWPLN